jgi:hypothetical protein
MPGKGGAELEVGIVGANDVSVMKEFVEVSVRSYAGCYALLNKGVVVYVGRSENVFTRVTGHRNTLRRWLIKKPSYTGKRGATDKIIHFDTVRVYPCSEEELDQLERRLIYDHQPELNVNFKKHEPRQKRNIDIKALIAKAGLDASEWTLQKDASNSWPEVARSRRF